MDAKAYNGCWDRFTVLMHREALPYEKPSVRQLRAAMELLRTGSCYVDFALFGARHIRTAKSWKWRGMVVGPGGVLMEQEIRGAPNYESWDACWNVYQCAMIMAGAYGYGRRVYSTIPHRLRRNGMEKYWVLLYQNYDRYRH